MIITRAARLAHSQYRVRAKRSPRTWRSVGSAVVAAAASVVMLLGLAVTPASAAPNTFEIGATWATKTSASDNSWSSLAYGEVGGTKMFAAVALGTTRIQTSPDGVTWTLRTAPAGLNWTSIVYGGGKFVAVASTVGGTSQQTMYSTDGVSWTFGSSLPATGAWRDVSYGASKFVAVGSNAVMFSSDGISWTLGTSPVDVGWMSVTYSGSRWAAVAGTGTAGLVRAMYSDNGETWTAATTMPSAGWQSVAYGASKFVAVSTAGKTASSADGVTWTQSTNGVPGNDWRAVAVGVTTPPAGGTPVTRFVAVSSTAASNNAMYSENGVDWTAGTSASTNAWYGLTYGEGRFVAVATTGTGTRVMMSNSTFLTYSSDTLTIVPPSGVTTTGYAIHYNTQARIDSSSAWGVWATKWPGATTSLNLATYQTGTAAPCGVSPTVCSRVLGQQASGQTRVYRAIANVAGSGYMSPNLTVTRP
ncbi:MAG: hypothetical protein QG597_1966 [Actinomycetota bacterium]|nr:hypothetical protein [Actinomycetota bacterium]